MHKVIVVGSGLSAIAAIKILVSKNIKPLILDYGKTLGDDKLKLKNKLSKLNKDSWDETDLNKLTENNTLKNRFPKKLYMGSNFFYFKKNNFLELIMRNKDEHSLPASSLAKNGLSTSWGSAVLPFSNIEQKYFPFDLNDLKKYYSTFLRNVNYVANEDSLTKRFCILKKPNFSHEIDNDVNLILKKFETNKTFNKEFISGKSRLLVNFSKINGCVKCGQCMSGCFYDHIYKPEIELNSLIEKKSIEYLSNVFVDSFIEKNGKVEVRYYDNYNKEKTIYCDKLILAAGALNTTIIHAKSYGLLDYKFKLLSKNGSVTPLLNMNFHNDTWPNRHTFPLIFLTLINDMNNINYYSQISKPNELIINRLYGSSNKHSFISKIFSKFFLIGHNNLSSINSDHYEFLVNKKKIKPRF